MRIINLLRIKWVLVISFLLTSHLLPLTSLAQKSQGIGTNTPNPRAVLDITVESPTTYPQGLLLPRLTTTQRNALGTVAGLAVGMAVFDSNDFKFYTWNGTTWVAAGSSNITTITGTNIASVTTIAGGYNIDVPYVSIVGINGLVVTSVGASFSISGQNIISSQWTTTGNNIYYDKGNVSIGMTTSGAALSILQDASIKPAVQLLGGATKSVFFELGRGSTDATIGVAGSASTISGLASSGDFVIKANAVNSNLILAAKNTGGNILFSTGLADNLSMFIATGGNVGIGTTLPGATFDVNGNARIRNLSVSGSVLTVDGLGNVGMGTISAGISQWTTTTNGIYVNTFVGIGNVNPTSPFHVQDVFNGPGGRTSVKYDIVQTIPNQNNQAIQLNYSVSGNGGTMLFTGFENNILGNPFISPPNTMQAYSAIVNVAGNGHVIGYQSSIAGSNVGKRTGFDANIQGSGNTQNIGINVIVSGATNNYAALLNGGNVGIGTTAPTTLLDVAGGVRFENLSVAGSVLTVDGLGNVGMGTLAAGLGGSGQTNGIGYFNSTNSITSNGANFAWDGSVMSVNGIRFYSTSTGLNSSVVIGRDAGNTTFTGTDNNFMGYRAGYSNTTGTYNNFFGYGAGISNTSGYENNIIGPFAGNANTTGYSNNFIGRATGLQNTTGFYNNFIGYQAGTNNIDGNSNNALGYQAGYFNTSGGNNNFIGSAAGYNNTIGLWNNFFGFNAGSSNIYGSRNIAIGFQADLKNSSNNLHDAIVIGSNATVGGSNTMAIGAEAGMANALTAVGISTGTPTAMLDVNGNARIRNLSVSGSVLTVDGLGNVGMGIISSSPSWQLGGNAITGGSSTILGASTNFPIGFYTNGTERMQITSAGNVGINNPSPFFSTALDLIGYGGGPALNVLAFSTGGSPYAIQAINNSNTQYTIQSINTFSGGGAASFSNPNASSSIARPVVLISASSTIPGYVALEVQGGIKFDNLNNAGSVLTVDGTGNVGMGTLATSANYWSLTGSNYVTIAPVTAVGIGTTSPIAALDVYQLNNSNVNNNAVNFNLIHQGGSGTKTGMYITYSFSGIGGTDNYRGVFLDLSGNNTGGSNINHGYYVNHNVTGTRPAMGYFANILGSSTGNKTGMGINVSGTGGAINKGLDIAVSGATNNYAAILNGGNVGIGTSTPNQALVVAGNTSISGISYLSSTVGIGVNTFTGFEAMRIGGVNPSSPKGIVFPYITTVQMAAITAAGLGPLDAGMGFYVIEYKDVTIWDGAQFSNPGGGNNNNNNYPSYNWDIYGSVSISGTSLSATGIGRLGTMDYSGLVLQTNNQPRMFIPASTLAGISIGMGNFLQTVTSTLSVKGDIGLGDGTSTNNGNVIVWLTNSNASALTPGTIVVVGTSDDSFNTSSTASDNSVIGVLTENCLSGNSCKVAVSGVVTVNVNGGSTRGQHCVTSATAGQALSVPVPSVGASIGVFLQTTAGTAARVLLR